jgi:hypothetical protein
MRLRRHYYVDTPGSAIEFRDKAQAKAYADMLRKLGTPAVLVSRKASVLPHRSERSLVEIGRRVSRNPEFWRERLGAHGFGDDESFWRVRAPRKTRHKRTR